MAAKSPTDPKTQLRRSIRNLQNTLDDNKMSIAQAKEKDAEIKAQIKKEREKLKKHS